MTITNERKLFTMGSHTLTVLDSFGPPPAYTFPDVKIGDSGGKMMREFE
jgi:hypothetical protein